MVMKHLKKIKKLKGMKHGSYTTLNTFMHKTCVIYSDVEFFILVGISRRHFILWAKVARDHEIIINILNKPLIEK